MTPAPPPVEKKATPIVVHRMTNFELAQSFPEKKALPAVGPRIPEAEPASSPPGGEEYEEIQGRPSQPSRSQRECRTLFKNMGFAVNLVMWTDVSKSALVFGLGLLARLLLLRQRPKLHTISAASYAGLIYLGLRFLRKSILSRGESVECDDDGASAAIAGADTVRDGPVRHFVTLWTLAKLVFFGVFIIPKVCSSYSTQLARYGK
ncbi:hypothetical protein Zm00014a_010701 [Zea mays]|uniref:Reticulon domain-containing protein n=1 Tax=Zea mays TaxID=4577 RepID=A0A3L6D690_MAIZE|nr:hypothetical protein Zm00014a_010701 [Zea mays]